MMMKLFKAIMIVFSLVSATSLFANSSLPSELSRLGLHGMILFSDGHALYASKLTKTSKLGCKIGGFNSSMSG